MVDSEEGNPISKRSGPLVPRYSLVGTYLLMASIECAIFPVFFPVSRELGKRRVRTRLRPPPASLAFSLSRWRSPRKIDFAAHNARLAHVSASSVSLERRDSAPREPFFSEAVPIYKMDLSNIAG